MDLKTKTVTSVQQIQVQLKKSFMHDTGSMTALKRLPSIIIIIIKMATVLMHKSLFVLKQMCQYC